MSRRLGALVASLILLVSVAEPAAADTRRHDSGPLAGFSAAALRVNEVAGALVDLAQRFPDAAGTMTADHSSRRIVQRYKANSPQAREFQKAVRRLPARGIRIQLKPTNHSERDLSRAVERLAGNPALAQRELGTDPVMVGYTDEGLDIVVPQSRKHRVRTSTPNRTRTSTPTTAAPVSEPAQGVTTVLGLPATVSATTQSDVARSQANSKADQAPWSAGAALLGSGSVRCTSGFVWYKRATRERLGSTAEHCRRDVGHSPRYQQPWFTVAGARVGNRYYYSEQADTQLLRATSGSFAPTIWVNRNTKRTVKQYRNSVGVGQVVALHGAASGYHWTTVQGRYLVELQNTGMTTWMMATNSRSCRNGDSGAPWFYQRSDGQVVAVGQHYGQLASTRQCLFIDIGTISNALQATVLTG